LNEDSLYENLLMLNGLVGC